jgi:hypothetical protein
MRFFPGGFDRSTAWMQENRDRERVGENAFAASLRQGFFLGKDGALRRPPNAQ